MTPGAALAAAAAAACALFAWLWWRSRREVARLRGRLEDAAARLERLQHTFSRFAPDSVIERAIGGGLDGRGEKREVTVLFADLAGYTPLAETLDPSQLVGILNGYFERMSRVIREHRGRISTFLGDGVLALFGAFEPNPWQGDDAARAALAMRAALADYNRELTAQGLPPLAFGVGLHRGVGVAGLVGSSDKKEFAIVGRTVNVAARVQGHTRQHESDILLTEDLARSLAPSFRLTRLAPVELKGVAAPVVLYALEGEAQA